MENIKYFDTELAVDTFVPYMDFDYKARFALDPEICYGIRAAGVKDIESEIVELLCDGFRQTLKKTLGEELRKRNMPL